MRHEASLFGLSGAILGCGAAFLMFRLFSLNAAAIGLVQAVPMPAGVFISTLVLGALIGVLSPYVPARSAARRNIVDALRMVA
jgi:ABC-type antimicrobial peptide transport system permease subunit